MAYVQENSIIEHLFWQCPSLPLPGEVDQVNGWVCVHRKLLDSPIFSNPKTLKVFLWCLLKATHQDYEAMVGRQRVALKPGQFITGRAKAAESLDMPPSTAWEYLKLLESNESIQICSTSTHSIITVVNWAAYQGYSTSDSKSDRDSNSEETPFEQSLSKDSGASSDRDSDSKPDSGSTADRHIQPYKHRTKDIICVLTEAEEAFLNTLSQVENYPLDRKRDLEMYRNLAERYPELDLCEAIEQWRVYKLDKPLTERSNPRSQINMSFKKYTEWGRCLKKSPVKEDWRCQKTLAEKTAHY